MKNVVTKTKLISLIAGSFFILSSNCNASEPFVYPAGGQTSEQTEKDKYECYNWAKGQAGFDPMQVPTASTPPPQSNQKSGGAVRGAARGALGGAIIGEIANDDAGKGAAYGAAGGAIGGAARQNRSNQQSAQAQQQWEQQESQKYANQRSEYNRAWAACLEGRGYTVK